MKLSALGKKLRLRGGDLFPILIWATVMAALIGVAAFAIQSHGHPLGLLILGGGIGITGAVGAVGGGITFSDRRDAETGNSREPWCSDCGKKMIPFRQQQGFDGKTGLPKIISIMKCPDWTQPTNAYMHIGDDRGRCRHAVVSALSAQCHDPLNTLCPVCVDKMVADGVLTKQEAALLR